ncbi:putative thioredoxin-disulfide reductase [Helianthus annuus]|uniref:Thioredoxin-disulfide reductase n=1 Tax=Helianthus annuus TaxID=4232 RepID=A0A9K3EEW2_HELAN|nr:putative thioredoxin-disulfide reductase [Helianthus annuus]KAJ0479433.1 putative thioredoxin-disulfide reductase [Helianthus annuus]KAJ0496322.1 putative thioredoxin-disulfide reductase [Helianthus annuus]KAJ0630164.1 putative thioredoxin-disulfide reductase [Helianthus annuus]KAJ0662383.1 putative thioredoxin-disulfide reductase [Helianthus annuus]
MQSYLSCKTWCGYCKSVKKLFSELNVSYKVIELDEESDGGEIQSALKEWTGQSIVPNVFIGGKHIGGSDAIMEKHQAGKLVPLLT